MKLIDYTQDRIPTYALYYLYYGEDDCLSDSEKLQIDEWRDEITHHLQAEYPDSYVEFELHPSESPSFTRFPAFGKACETQPCIFAVYTNNNDDRWQPIPHPFAEEDEPCFQ